MPRECRSTASPRHWADTRDVQNTTREIERNTRCVVCDGGSESRLFYSPQAGELINEQCCVVLDSSFYRKRKFKSWEKEALYIFLIFMCTGSLLSL